MTDVTLGRRILRAIANKSYSKIPRTNNVRKELELLVSSNLIIMPTTFWVRLSPSGVDFVQLAASDVRWNTARLLVRDRKQAETYLILLGTLQELRQREQRESKVG